MRYWECVARGLQSRVLRQVTNKLSNMLLFAFKHPLKTCWYIFRAYLVLLLAGLCLTFLTSKAIASDIYELASGSVNASTTVGCQLNPTPSEWVNQKSDDAGLPKVNSRGQTVNRYSLKSLLEYNETDETCEQIFMYEGSYSYVERGETVVVTNEYYGSVYGRKEEVPQCPPAGSDGSSSTYPEHRLLHTLDNGTHQCFTAQSLEDVDSCDTDNPDVLGTSSSPEMVCLTKDDGSKCAMQKYEVNGQFAYSQNLEPSSCYEGEIAVNPYEDPTTNDLTGTECQELGNGIRACPSDPSEVCNSSTGECNTGCGTYDIGNGPEFMCLQDSGATCDPTTTASCSDVTTPEDPTEEPDPYEPPVTPEDPEFQTATGTNSLLTGTNEILSGVEQGVQGVSTGVQGVKSELEDIKEEMQTTKTVVFDNDIYTANDYNERNYGTVLEDAVTQMRNTELVQSVNTFFDVDLSGTCPVYSTSVPYINATITIDQFCGSVMTSIWPIVSAIIILVFSVLAFRVAVL